MLKHDVLGHNSIDLKVKLRNDTDNIFNFIFSHIGLIRVSSLTERKVVSILKLPCVKKLGN